MMNKEINLEQYQLGIFDTCKALIPELIEFLKREGRYKYRMITYMNAFLGGFDRPKTEEEVDISGRVMYNLRPVLEKSYRKLRSKRLTPADCVICILIKLIDTSNSLEGGQGPIQIHQSTRDLFQKIYDNIGNKAKLDPLNGIGNRILECTESKKWGTLSLSGIDFLKIEFPGETHQELQGEKDSWGTTGKEIDL